MSKKFDDWTKLIDFMGGNPQGRSLKEIMAEFGVSLRTAQRWIQAVSDEYKYIEEKTTLGREKRWYLSERLLSRKLSITASDLLILAQSTQLLEQQNLTIQSQGLENLQRKLESILLQKSSENIQKEIESQLFIEGFAFRPGPRFTLNPEILNLIREALINKKVIKVKYLNKSSQKISANIIEPYGLLYGERNHYLLARHHDNYCGDEIHHFILHNIHSVKLLETPYILPQGFDLKMYCKDMFGVFNEDPFDVEWLFNKEVANEVKHYLFHPTQEMIENDNGSITVKFKAGGAVEMSWFLYMWGKNVTVIKPVDFWMKMKKYQKTL